MARKKPVIIKPSIDKKVGFGKYKDKELLEIAKTDLAFFKKIEELYYTKYDSSKQKYYKQILKRFVEKDGLISKDALIKYVDEVIVLMKQRKTSTQITEYLTSKYNLSLIAIHNIVSDANSIIRKEFESEKSLLLDLHLLRYEEIFIENFNVDLTDVPAGYKKAVKCEHLITAMDTLFQKERLLGVHTKNFKLKISNSVLEKKEVEFDITKISREERLEMFSLLNKAKVKENFIQPISPNSNPLNIDLKKNIIVDDSIEAPIKQAVQTDIMGDNEKLTIQTSGKSLIEVQQSMADNLKNKVKELFEKKKNQK